MEKIKLRVITPEGELISDEYQVISLISTAGMIEIMCGHENMLIELKEGDIIYDKDKKISVKSGFARVSHNICEIVVEK